MELDIYVQTNELTSQNTKKKKLSEIPQYRITDLNIIAKIIKLSEENIGENLCDSGWGKDFLDTMPKANSFLLW